MLRVIAAILSDLFVSSSVPHLASLHSQRFVPYPRSELPTFQIPGEEFLWNHRAAQQQSFTREHPTHSRHTPICKWRSRGQGETAERHQEGGCRGQLNWLGGGLPAKRTKHEPGYDPTLECRARG